MKLEGYCHVDRSHCRMRMGTWVESCIDFFFYCFSSGKSLHFTNLIPVVTAWFKSSFAFEL